MEKRINSRRFTTGVVISDKMDKTRLVQVNKMQKHAKYQKQVRGFTKYKAHDEKNESKIGDRVVIMESRPLSKDKRWIITQVQGDKSS